MMKRKESIVSDRSRTDRFFGIFVKIIPLCITPNRLTIISLFLAIISAVLYCFSGKNFSSLYLSFALIFLMLSSFLDALDGTLARVRGLSSKRGNYLDHVIDRYVDTLLILGITFGGYVDWKIGIVTVSIVLIVSYMGAEAEAKIKIEDEAKNKPTAKREYRGIMGRGIRLSILIVLTALNIRYMDFAFFDFTFIGLAMIIFAVGGFITIIQRFYYTWKALPKSG